MKAAQITSYGGKDVLKTVTDASKPEISEGEVLVQVHAAAVNPFDWKVREGQTQTMAELHFPATLGGDFAGKVVEVGEEVSDIKVDDEVYGQANALGGQGSFAEFTPVRATALARKPKSIDFVQAAVLPLTSVSAYQALVEHLNLQAGQKILIHGGAGGIGSSAIPLAKHLGAHIATTALADDADYVKSLGADKVIDYKSQDFTTLLKDYDAVYDTVGGDTYQKSYQVLKPGGIIVSMLEQPNQALMSQYNVQAIAQFTRVTRERLEAIAKLVDEGVITANIDKTFPLDQAAEALEYLHASHHRGKVVIKVT